MWSYYHMFLLRCLAAYRILTCPFTFYVALTLTNIRNQVARPTSRASRASQPANQPAKSLAKHKNIHSQPSSQLSSQPAGQPKTKPMQKHPGSQPAGQPAGQPAKTQAESGRPAGRGSYTRLVGRPAELNTDWPAEQEIAGRVPRAVSRSPIFGFGLGSYKNSKLVFKNAEGFLEGQFRISHKIGRACLQLTNRLPASVVL